MADRWTQWVYADAPRYGVDPAAADAISRGVEWPGRGGAGDAGTSFGPFQLHVGGALPHGRGRRWAESRAGVDYALAQMAAHGARGLRGPTAIAAIARNFERPANVAREINLATNFYRGRGGVPAGAAVGAAIPALARRVAGGKLVKNPARNQALMSYLSNSLSQYVATGRIGGDVGQLASIAAMAPMIRQGGGPRPVSSRAAATVGARMGKVVFAPTADRPGVHTSAAVKNFLSRLAGIAGHPINVGTGTNHSRMTVDGNVSDHWSGHAADIPATGKALIQLGRQALIAAGMPRAKALKQTGGLYNVNGHQIIFNTHIGGDHTNHVHVSAH